MQTRAVEGTAAGQRLTLQPRFGPEFSLVKHFRRKFAQPRMQPPRGGNEDALRRRQRALAAQQMVQRRHADARRMTALLGLLQLHRVAEIDDRRRRPGHRQRVRECHLTGLVDHEHVHCVRKFAARPQVLRAAQHVRVIRDGVQRVGVRHRLFDVGAGQITLLQRFRGATHRDPQLIRSHQHPLQQIADHLVTVRTYANTFALAHQIDDQLRAEIGLARPGWTLHRQDAVVEAPADRLRIFDQRVCRNRQRNPCAKTRRPPQQQIPRGTVWPRRVDAVVDHPVRKAQQRLFEFAGIEAAEIEHAARMHGRRLRRLLDVDPAVANIQVVHRPHRLAVRPEQCVAADPALLRRKAVAMHRRPPRPGHLPDEFQPAERFVLVHVVRNVQLHEAELLPPHLFVFAPVVVLTVGEQPARVLFGAALRLIDRHIRRQLAHDVFDPRNAFGQLLALLDHWRSGPRNIDTRIDLLLPQPLQPIVQCRGGQAIVAVVALHRWRDVLAQPRELEKLDRAFQHRARIARLAQRHRARERIERFHVLQPVTLDAGAQALAQHLMQVDEQTMAQPVVHPLLARCVAAHQPLDGRRLVVIEVVDVQVWIRGPARLDKVNECFERLLLLRRVERPPRPVLPRAVAAPGNAQQIFQARRAGIPVAFDIEIQIAGRRLGQATEAVLRQQFQQFEYRRVRVAPRHLHPRLFANALVRLDCTATGPKRQRLRQLRKRTHGVHVVLGEFAPLARENAGHQRQVIVAAPHALALHLPTAQVAQRDRLGVGRHRHRDGAGQPCLHAAEIRQVVAGAVPLRRHALRGDDADALRQHALQLLQKLRIQTQLQNRRALSLAGELGVHHFVGPVAQRAGRVRLQQHVRAAAPRVRDEHGLDDHLRPGREQRAGAGDAGAGGKCFVDHLGKGAAFCLEML